MCIYVYEKERERENGGGNKRKRERRPAWRTCSRQFRWTLNSSGSDRLGGPSRLIGQPIARFSCAAITVGIDRACIAVSVT